MQTRFRFINRSSATHEPDVLVFLRPVVMEIGSLTLAWKVIRYCGYDSYHPFTVPHLFELAVVDSWGNFMPTRAVEPGERVAVQPAPFGSGKQIRKIGPSRGADTVEVVNELKQGALSVLLMLGGRPIASREVVAPGQKAVFVYTPTIFLAVVSGITEGAPLDSAVMDDQAFAVPLLGISAADIVLTGGGPGQNSQPFTFSLEGIKRVSYP